MPWEIYNATPSTNANNERAYGALAPRLAEPLFVADGAALVPDPVPVPAATTFPVPFGEGETTAPESLDPLLLLLPLLTPPVEEGGV